MTSGVCRFPALGARLSVGALAALFPLLGGGCTHAQLQGNSNSYLIVDALRGASGATPDKLSGVVASDVITNGSIFEDPGQVTFLLGLRDPGAPGLPTVPTSANFITVTRYHVAFVRSDGRNTQGVDVPYAFDGAMTLTVRDILATGTFMLVRAQAKEEAPLKALANQGGALLISTIAQVTFYGQDQTGRAVSVTGQISVNFADWADPPK